MDKIVVNDIKVDCIIGVYSHERNNKQPLIINLELYYDFTMASASDNLEHSIDYDAITNKVYSYVAESKFQLLEALTKNILKILIVDYNCVKATVNIHKPQALKNGKVSIHMSKTRDEV